MVVVEGLESLEELVSFLGNPRPEVRAMGAQVALTVTETEEGRRGLVNAGAIPVLCRLSGDHERVAEPAISTLINICADELPGVVEEALKRGIVDRLMETVTSEGCGIRDRALMLLANVTVGQQGAKKMMQIREEEDGEGSSIEGLHVRRLLHWFLKSQPKTEDDKDEWQYVSSVLCNISQLQQGRDVLRRKSTNLLTQLLPQLRSPNTVRRRGIASAVRNCCFEEEDHWWLMEEVNLVPHVLYPIMGPDDVINMTPEDAVAIGIDPLVTLRGEKGKRREADVSIRRTLLETLLLFCSSRRGREGLRKRGVYEVIRDLDQEYETDDDNAEVIYKLVNFLQRDEEEGKDLNSAEGGVEEPVKPAPVKTKNYMDMLD